MALLLNLLINTSAVLISAYLLKGVQVQGLGTAVVVAVALGIVNTFIRPVLILLTLPLTFLTLGLFLFVINALLILLVSAVVRGFEVNNFWWALAYSLVVSLVSGFLHSLA
jgi:putative membrane protein